MTSARLIVVGWVLTAATAVLAPHARAAQADSTPPDSTLTRRSDRFSRITLRGAAFRTFFADDPEHLLVLVPGVVLRGAETGLAGASVLSIRGGAPGAASVYIDGARTGLRLGSSSLADVSVSTGAPDLGLPDLRNGIIEYHTQSGGPRLSGALRAASDEAFPGVGFNRFDGSIGGPLPGLANVTFFVGGTVTGQRSHYVGLGSENVPNYVPGGIDTVVVDGGGMNHVLVEFADHRSYDWGTDLRGHAKLQLTTASGTAISITGVANEMQERFFPGMSALAPTLYTGSRAGGRLVVANWRQPLGTVAGRPLWLHVHGSLISSRTTAGLLEAESQIASRDPALGITLETLQFTGADSVPMPVTEQLIRNIRTNSGWRVPFLNHDELRNVQTSRGNPYAMQSNWVEDGLDGVISMALEKRTDARVALEWGAPDAHHVTVGGDVGSADVSSYTSNLLRQSFMDVYRSEPRRAGVFVSDHLGRGDLRAEVGLRFDHFGSVGLFPTTPGRIYSHPAFNRPSAIADDTAYTNSVARVMTPGRSHDAVSFRTIVEHDLGLGTSAWAAFGTWVEAPSLGMVLRNSNTDLDFANTNELFGRDVEYGRASVGEIGTRHQFAAGLAVEAAIYRRTRPAYGPRIESFADPSNPGDVFNIIVVAKLDDPIDLGLDLAVEWNIRSWVSFRGVYTRGLTDPGFGESFATQALTAAAVVRGSGGWLAGVEASALLRLTSGLPYTQLDPAGGTGALAVRRDFSVVSNTAETLNASQLPGTKNLDLRLTKVLKVGRQDFAAFADFRNVMNFKNILNLFAETGDVVNPNHRVQSLDVEFQNLESEAANNSRLLSNGDIDLVPNCASWTQSSAPVVNCVALQRAETRFGNGDGVYTLAERTTALHAFYDGFYGPQTFYGSGRSVRLGVEIRW